MDGVVPLAMEFVTGDAEAGHLLIGYDNSLWIGARVEFAADGKPGLCCGGADEIDDHTIADQRLRLPVHRDEREQAVLHLVPFARTRRQVVNGDVDAQLVGKTLEFKLPQPHARAIAAAAIGGDGQPGGAGIAQTTNLLPPAADRLNRERRRVAAHANAHPAGIGCEIVDAIRHRPAEFLDQEVMHPDLLRVALRTPVPTGVLEVSDQLVSRPAVFHRQPLSERCVRLSPHTAPIRRTRRSCQYASVRTWQVGPEPASQGSGQPYPCAPESA